MDLSEESRTVEIHVEHVGVLNRPVCGGVCSLYDHSSERRWRDLDTMGFATFVVARVPGSNYRDHGVKQLGVPWASPNSHMTHGLEDWTIRVLELTKSQIRTARLLRLSAQQVHDVMHRAVVRGLARRRLCEISHVSVDEKGFQRGRKFATVVCDTGGKRVLEVELGRDEKTAIAAFPSIPEPEKVKTVSLDMAESFRNAAMAQFPNADIVHDRFHVAAMLGEAVDDTRRAEVKKHPELRESRFIWLKNPENLTANQKAAFDALVGTELKTAEAYAFKQTFRAFFEQDDVPAGTEFFENWTAELEGHDLPKMHKVTRTLEKNIQGLLNYLKWRITNAYGESPTPMEKPPMRSFRKSRLSQEDLESLKISEQQSYSSWANLNSIHTKPHKAREKPIGSDASREFYSLIGSISDSDWDSLLDHQVSRCDQLAITSNLIRYLKSDSSIRLNSSKVLDDWHLLALENCPEVPDEVSKVEVIPTLTRVVKNYPVGRPIPDGWDPFPAIGTYLCPRAAVMQDDDGKLVLILNREKAEARMNREMFWLGNRVDYDVRLYLSPGILIEQTISGSVVADKASFRYTDLTAAERDEAWIEGQRQAFDWAKSHPPVDMTAPKQQSESAGGIPPFAMR